MTTPQDRRRSAGIRNTPAYAGKRRPALPLLRWHRDHPRICGEKQRTLAVDNEPQGSPPHMQGKGERPERQGADAGITPAYAGKSSIGGSPRSQHWDHPRMCGEKEMLYRTKAGKWGSPSHMRGKANLECHRIVFDRITPAYAGKRPPQSPPSGQSRDHPRICVAKTTEVQKGVNIVGSPPHMRGKGIAKTVNKVILRITPACAGKSP